jgi:hypothetical protein
VREGGVVNLAIAFIGADGIPYTAHAGSGDWFALIGAVATLEDELLHPEPPPAQVEGAAA